MEQDAASLAFTDQRDAAVREAVADATEDAAKTGAYYLTLRTMGVPPKLAGDLTLAWQSDTPTDG